MADLFADTAGWAHLADARQSHHERAAEIYRARRRQGDRVLTTSYVLLELVALLISPLRVPRSTLVALVESIKKSPHVEVVHVDAALDRQAWRLLSERQDKNWSLVDCSSFVLMQQRGLQEAFTTDHHFEQAGFTRLLKP